MCLRVSITLHEMIYEGVSRARMIFFHQNASGRILNRFSKDIGSVDSQLPVILVDCIQVRREHSLSLLVDKINILIKFLLVFSRAGWHFDDSSNNKRLASAPDIIHVRSFLRSTSRIFNDGSQHKKS